MPVPIPIALTTVAVCASRATTKLEASRDSTIAPPVMRSMLSQTKEKSELSATTNQRQARQESANGSALKKLPRRKIRLKLKAIGDRTNPCKQLSTKVTEL